MDFLFKYRGLAVCTVIASVAFSVWCIYADPIINNDGIRYVRAASAFAAGDFSTGAAIYKWPFYSLIIAGISKTGGLDVGVAAYVLNAVLIALLLLAFLAVVYTLGADRTVLIAAAIVILMFPELNKYRSFVIRDIGYLAFYLWSLVFLFRYWKASRNQELWKWFACIAVACMFRVEGVVFLVLIPVLVWMRVQVGAVRRFGQYLVLALAGGALFIGLSIWLFVSESGASQADILSQPWHTVRTAWAQMGDKLWLKLTAIEEEVLTGVSADYSAIVLVAALVILIVVEIVRRLSIVYALIVGHAVSARLTFPEPDAKELWYRLIALNLGILLAFATVQSFLVGRYTMGTLLTLLLAAPFSLAHLYKRWRSGQARRKWLPVATGTLLLLLGLESLDVYTDKRFLRDAGLWLRQNTAPSATLFADNQALIYYSGKTAFRDGARYDWAETMSTMYREDWRRYDYLAVRISRSEPHRQARIEKLLGRKPVKTFANRKGDKVLIYKTS